MGVPANESKYIRWFEETTIDDVPLVGGKNASLGEIYRELSSKGIQIPNGFSVTAEAYWHTLKIGGILEKLKTTMEGLDTADVYGRSCTEFGDS
jgi:pyruvate, water dikinase